VNGCQDSISVSIEGPLDSLIAAFTIDPDTGLQPLEIDITNLTIGGTHYTWLMGDGVYRDDTLNFSHVYNDSGNIHITLIAINEMTGCIDTSSYELLYVIPTSELVVPNVYTPNGHGVNDQFLPDVRNLTKFSGTIYNRWGEKVYNWNKSRSGWDGRAVAGIELPSGTYFYVITGVGVDADRETDYKFFGAVNLIR
jgi:gliding motility-associated-like protein